MLTRSFLVLATIAWSGVALAQTPAPTTYTLTLDGKQIDLIGRALGALPFSEVAPLINQLGREINEQNAARSKAAQPAEPPK